MQEVLTATTKTIGLGGFKYPITITFDSDTVGRKIEFSTNYGTEYWEPVIDKTTATMLVTYSELTLTHIKVTGDIGDILTVLSAGGI